MGCASVTLTLYPYGERHHLPASEITSDPRQTNTLITCLVRAHFFRSQREGLARCRLPGLHDFGTLPSCVRLMSLPVWPEPRRPRARRIQEAAFCVCQPPGCARVLAGMRVLVHSFLFSDRSKLLASSGGSARLGRPAHQGCRGTAHPRQPRRVIRLVCASPGPGASNYMSGACQSPGGRLTCSQNCEDSTGSVLTARAASWGRRRALCVTFVQIIITAFQRQQESI